MKFNIDEFREKLPLPKNRKWPEGVWDTEAFRKGDVSMVFFAPRFADHQTEHEDDEFYFIARGTGVLVIDGERNACEAGSAFFVAAGVSHHFENFSHDFATWAVFF